jgi:hypothetical protein
MIKEIKNKIRQLFCKHENIEYMESVSKFHPLHGQRIYMFCADCGKELGSRFYTNEELCMKFKEYCGDNWKAHILNSVIIKGVDND